jgi:hypothetical protein
MLLAGNDDKVKREKTVSGKILDSNGESIPGAAIFISEINKTVYADLDGNFKLQLPAEKILNLNVSVLGYQTLEVSSKDLSLFKDLVLVSL